MKKLVITRRFSQAFFLSLFVYILWSTTYPLKGLLPPETFFAADPHMTILLSLSGRVLIPGLLISAAMLLITLIFGRFFCGWVCPLGAFIDMTGSLRRNKPALSDTANARARKPKFFILGASLIAALLGVQIAWVTDPIVIAARFVSMNLIPTATIFVDNVFIFLIKDLHLQEPFYGSYQSLKTSFLGVKAAYFDNAMPIFMLFAVTCFVSLALSRAWCRSLCPLGALYALTSKTALLKRTVKGCVKCGRCASICRTGAIRKDASYSKGECVLCMDCVYDCPAKITRFSFSGNGSGKKTGIVPEKQSRGLSRWEFLVILASSFALTAFKFRGTQSSEDGIIRPPASLKESDFNNRCIRCGNCMKVCPTNGLQPCFLEAGHAGIWTPRLVPDIGYCEYNCTLCGNVCPTGAIKKLSTDEKHATKLGLAKVNHSICLAWANGKQCLVCEEHCPVFKKAITADTTSGGGSKYGRPVVNKDLCVGCGICQTKCPVRPNRAIRVFSEGADRV